MCFCGLIRFNPVASGCDGHLVHLALKYFFELLTTLNFCLTTFQRERLYILLRYINLRERLFLVISEKTEIIQNISLQEMKFVLGKTYINASVLLHCYIVGGCFLSTQIYINTIHLPYGKCIPQIGLFSGGFFAYNQYFLSRLYCIFKYIGKLFFSRVNFVIFVLPTRDFSILKIRLVKLLTYQCNC